MPETLLEAKARISHPNLDKVQVTRDHIGTSIICLRREDEGYYVPCEATLVRITPKNQFVVYLYGQASEAKTVSADAVYTTVPRS